MTEGKCVDPHVVNYHMSKSINRQLNGHWRENDRHRSIIIYIIKVSASNTELRYNSLILLLCIYTVYIRNYIYTHMYNVVYVLVSTYCTLVHVYGKRIEYR